MTVGMFAMMAFHLTDTWFISKLGTQALAAMGFTFPVVMLIHSLSVIRHNFEIWQEVS